MNLRALLALAFVVCVSATGFAQGRDQMAERSARRDAMRSAEHGARAQLGVANHPNPVLLPFPLTPI